MSSIRKVVLLIIFLSGLNAALCYGITAGHCVIKQNQGKNISQSVDYKSYKTSDVTYCIYDVVDEDARFPGGVVALLQYINRSLRYPAQAYEDGVQGRVLCSFVIEKDGRVSDVRVLRGVEPSLDDEAVRVISEMPHWSPGILQGQVVRSRYIMPIVFRI